MSLIVPWTDPNGEPCCCIDCNEAQPPNYSLVELTPSALTALNAGGDIVIEFGVSVNFGGNGSFGSSAAQTGVYAIRAESTIPAGCANTATANSPAFVVTQNTIACSYVNPTSSLIWSVQSSTCLATLGALGLFAYALNGNSAFIRTLGGIVGSVSRSWSGTDPSTGSVVASTSASATFTFSFASSAINPLPGTTAGNVSLIINGSSFLVPVSYQTLINAGFGTVEWIGDPSITFTSAAP